MDKCFKMADGFGAMIVKRCRKITMHEDSPTLGLVLSSASLTAQATIFYLHLSWEILNPEVRSFWKTLLGSYFAEAACSLSSASSPTEASAS